MNTYVMVASINRKKHGNTLKHMNKHKETRNNTKKTRTVVHESLYSHRTPLTGPTYPAYTHHIPLAVGIMCARGMWGSCDEPMRVMRGVCGVLVGKNEKKQY